MKKITYFLLVFLSVKLSIFAQQAVLPTSWDFSTTSLPTGWTSSGSGFAYYSGSGNPAPAAKFSLTGDKLIISFNSTPGAVSYDIVGNPVPGNAWNGTFVIEESVDGNTWTMVGSSMTNLAATYTSLSNNLSAASRYVRFHYQNKVSGNVGLDNVNISVGVSTAQEIKVKQGSTTIVNGGTYTTSSPVSTMASIAFTVQNTGTVDTLHVSAAALSGPAAADYAIVSPTVFSVAPSSDSMFSISFTPSVAGTRDAVLTLTSDDANGNGSYIINLDGIGGNFATEPTAQPTSLTFPLSKSYRITGSFTAASPAPDGYIVLRRKGAAITDVPVDGTAYKRGDLIGSSQVVYSSTATGFLPRYIEANTHYYFAVFAYNGVDAYRNYLTTSPLTGDVTSSGSMEPNGYYSSASTSDSSFVTDLHAIVNPHTLQLYSNYGPNMVTGFYARDTVNDQRVVTCVYSGENKVYTDPFDWTSDNFSREHTYCHSWMPTTNDPSYENRPEYNDYHLLTPTNQNNVNAIRSNYPLGVVVGTPLYTYHGSKLGYDARGKKVFEPRDSDKGDAARCMLYQCIAYTGVAYTGPVNTDATYAGSWGLPTYISTTIPYSQEQDVLKQWNTMDPPDNLEIARNDYVDSLQGNRNPFIDHPEYVCYIDFKTMTYVASGNCADTAVIAGVESHSARTEDMFVWPNPSNGAFKINYSCDKNQKVNIALVDVLGHVVYTNQLKGNTGFNSAEISVSNLSKGVYMLQWKTESNYKTQRVIIE